MSKCHICGRRNSRSNDLSFHSFPSNEERKQKWIDIIGELKPPPGKRSTICSIHFTEDCFRYGLVYGTRRLKEGSNPSLYLQETEKESLMLNELHKNSISEVLVKVIDESNRKCGQDILDFEDDQKLPKHIPYTRRKQRVQKKLKPRQRFKLNLTWDQITRIPNEGKGYWEAAQRELNIRQEKIKSLKVALAKTREKLSQAKVKIRELKDDQLELICIPSASNADLDEIINKNQEEYDKKVCDS